MATGPAPLSDMPSLITSIYGKLDRLLSRALNSVRLIRLRLLGARIGRGVKVYGRFVINGDARNLCIGDGSTINEGVFFDLRDTIAVGRGVRLSSYVRLHTSRLDTKKLSGGHLGASIVLGDGVWLASGVVVCGGVTVGSGSVIGANAVVLSDIEPCTFAAGLPARQLNSQSA